MLLLGNGHVGSLLLHQHRLSENDVVLGDRVQKLSFVCGSQYWVRRLRCSLFKFLFLLVIRIRGGAWNFAGEELGLHCLIRCENLNVWCAVIIHLPWLTFVSSLVLLLWRQLLLIKTWLGFRSRLQSHEGSFVVVAALGVLPAYLIKFVGLIHVNTARTTYESWWNQTSERLLGIITCVLLH